MKIIVCIKQVPETTEVNIDPETKRIVRDGVKGIINPYDMYAIEEAVRLKERFGGETVVITMGPPQADSALRDALAMGIDRAVLVSDRKFGGSDTLATAYTLSCAVRKLGGFDILLAGRETLDGSTGQVGPGMAENLSIPSITFVSKIINISDGTMECLRLMENHYETLKTSLPALLTVVKEINEPRIPSLKGLLRAKKAAIETWTAADIGGEDTHYGQDGSPTRVVECWRPSLKKEGKIVRGEPEEVVDVLHGELKQLGVI